METKRLTILKFMTVVLLLGCNLVVMAQIHPGMQQSPGVGVRISWSSNDGVKVKSSATARQVPVPGMPVIPSYMNRGMTDPLQRKMLEKAAIEGPEVNMQTIKESISQQIPLSERQEVSQSTLFNPDSVLQRRISRDLQENTTIAPEKMTIDN